jgi:hypothetical protein
MDIGLERMRLAAVYAAMADGELEALAVDWESLTEAAHLALKDEMDRRGLRIENKEAKNTRPEAEEDRLVEPVTVVEFVKLEEATVARGLLASGGIPSMLVDFRGNPIGPGWFGDLEFRDGTTLPSGADAGIRLLVNAADLQEAREVLKEPVDETEHLE